MGLWLRQYGESIYATRGGPFKPGPWGVATHNEKYIYLHILDWPTDTLLLPPLPQPIISSDVLTGGQAVVEQRETGITVTVPALDRHPIDTIVRLAIAQ
jgi:alpha-L-fucosidase